MKEKAPEHFRLDFAVSREQTNEKGEKMYIQTRMAQYAEELWEMLKKDNTYVYMCGLKGMEKGIDDIMISLAAKDGKHFIHTLRINVFWLTNFTSIVEVNSGVFLFQGLIRLNTGRG